MRPVVMDTGPLRTYLSLGFLNEARATPGDRAGVALGPEWDSNRQERFLAFIKSRAPVLITSHVVVEVFRVRDNDYLKRRESDFWGYAADSLTDFDERAVTLRDLFASGLRDLIVQYGPADAGLIWLASRERAIVLTGDRRLYSALGSDSRFEMLLLDHWEQVENL